MIWVGYFIECDLVIFWVWSKCIFLGDMVIIFINWLDLSLKLVFDVDEVDNSVFVGFIGNRRIFLEI